MKALRKLRPVVAVAGVLMLAAACGNDGAADESTSTDGPLSAVEQVTNYSGADREQHLYDCAKKEGTFTLYTSSSAAKTVIAPAFEAKYPGVHMEVYAATTDLVQHLVEEEDAGKHNFDIYGDIYGNLARDSNYFARYSSPGESAILPELVTPYYVGVNGFIMGAAYNPNLVKGADIPKSYADLADPKWAGKIAGGFDTSTPITYAVVKDQLGDDLMAKFAKNVKVTEGVSSRGVTDLMEAGTFPIAWSISASYQKKDAIAKGLPFQFIPLDPMVAFYSTYSVSAQAPHPCAATLAMDWMIDTRPGGGQEIWAGNGELSPLKDGPRLPFEIPGTDSTKWHTVDSNDPSIVKGFEDYLDAAGNYTTDFRNQFLRS